MAFMQNIMSDQDVSVLLEMLETGELCDFKFVANDNSEIKVHAHFFTLSSLSEKFKTEHSNLKGGGVFFWSKNQKMNKIKFFSHH